MFEARESLSFSKFCQLRPKNVKLRGDFPLVSCLFVHPENFRTLFNTLAQSFEDLPDLTLPINTKSSFNLFLCKSNCFEKCENCEQTLFALIDAEKVYEEAPSYELWDKDNNTDKVAKVLQQDKTFNDIYNDIVVSLSAFKHTCL